MPSALNPPPSLAQIQQQQQQQRQRSDSVDSHDSHDSHGSGESHSSHSSYAERHPDRVPPKAASPDRPFVTVLAVLALLLFYNATGLWLFIKGFLLTRVELSGINQCYKPPVASWSPPAPPTTFDKSRLLDWGQLLHPQDGTGECTLPATHSKAVIIIIDALRYDFIAPIPAVSSRVEDGWKPNPYYHAQLPLPAELTSMSPQKSFLAHFAADAPTTTLQRLKGLSTGTLPTFIEAGANFGGMGKVNEDNWLAQLRAKVLRDELHRDHANAGLVFAGDDTWATVFPDVFDHDKVWSYDSFNVEDLDTVDAGVESKLLPFLQKSHPDRKAGVHTDWRLLVGHTLGIDHVGHRFGPSHPKMQVKMAEMQRFLLNITSAMDDQTLLVLMGDHGMDSTGDHGGDGELEIGSGLWVWSRSGFGKSAKMGSASGSTDYLSTEPIESLVRSRIPFSPLPSPPFDARGHRSVPQIDLVPSLSLLLGLPVPFNSLGSVIPELFPSPDRLLRALRITSFQMKTYLDRYASTSSDLATFTSELDELWLAALEADARYSVAFHARRGSADLAKTQQQAAQAYAHFTRASLTRARSVWAQFEMIRIGLGLIVLSLALVSTYILWSGVRTGLHGVLPLLSQTAQADDEPRSLTRRISANLEDFGTVVLRSSAAPAAIGSFVSVAILLLSKLAPKSSFLALPLTLLDALLFGASVGSQIGLIAPHLQRTCAKMSFEHDTPSTTKALQGLGIVTMIVHAALFASNSFTIWEDRVVLALLGTLLLARLAMGLGAPTQRMKIRMPIMALLALVLVRLASLPKVCREEQAPNCSPNFYATAGASQSTDTTHGTAESGSAGGAALNSPFVIAASYVLAYLLPTLLGKALDSSKSFVGIAPVFCNWILRPTLLIGSAYWLVDWALPLETVAASGWKPTLEWLKNLAAKLDLVFLLVPALAFWVFAPLCLELRQEAVPEAEAAVQNGEKPKQRVSIMGYANSLGSSYVLLLGVLFSALWIVTQPAGQLAFAAVFLAGILNADLGDSERDVLILHRQRLTSKPDSADDSDADDDDEPNVAPALNSKQRKKKRKKGVRAPIAPTPTASANTETTTLSPLERAAQAASAVPSDSAATAGAAPGVVFTSIAEIATVVLLGHIAFFGTGHQATIGSIQWRVAFIGFGTVAYPWSPLMVIANSFGHLAFFPALLAPLNVLWNYAPRPRSTAPAGSPARQSAKMHLPSQLLYALLTLLLYHTLLLVSVSSLSALVFRRHLMLFKIWTPRFMLAAVSSILTIVSGLLATLATWQIANKVNRIFGTEFQ